MELGGDVVDEPAEGAAAHQRGEHGVLGTLDVHLDDHVPLVHSQRAACPRFRIHGLALIQKLDEARQVDRAHVEGDASIVGVSLSEAPADAATTMLGAHCCNALLRGFEARGAGEGGLRRQRG